MRIQFMIFNIHPSVFCNWQPFLVCNRTFSQTKRSINQYNLATLMTLKLIGISEFRSQGVGTCKELGWAVFFRYPFHAFEFLPLLTL